MAAALSGGQTKAPNASERLLIAVQLAIPQTANDKQVTFAYDYMGRRVRKAIYAWDPTVEHVWE